MLCNLRKYNVSHILLLSSIVFLAFLLRFVGISSYPVGFTPDEASFGYDAYSLLKTGRDQWGESWPLTFRSFGDFKLPLYGYLTVPSIALFGLNEFAVRLPNAIFGTLAILATYLMVGQMFRDRKIQLFSAFLLAISPWHVSLSRGAFEANLTTFFMPFGIWAFLKGVKKPHWMVVSAIAFGLNLFSYHSARLITPLIVLSLLWFNTTLLRTDHSLWEWRSVGKHKWGLSVFSAFLVIAVYTVFFGAGARGADIAIFNPTDKWSAVSDRRYEAFLQGLPDGVARVFSNKVVYVIDNFVNNYFSYLSPQFLFTQGAGEWTYGMIPGWGVLYLIELPFLLFALWGVFARRPLAGLSRGRLIKVILIWILLAPIPAALTKGAGFAANRVSVMMPAVQVLSAYGAVVLWDVMQKRWPKYKQALLACYLVSVLVSLGFFLEDYRYHAPKSAAGAMLYGRRDAVDFAESLQDRYGRIVFSKSLSEPQIYVAFYGAWDPKDYQEQAQGWLRYEKEGLLFVDQLGEYGLGKYVFSGVNNIREKNESNIVLVGKPEEFRKEDNILKAIYYPGGKPAILLTEFNPN